jgi:hypothetical protein
MSWQALAVGGGAAVAGSLISAYAQGKISKEQLVVELGKLQSGVFQNDSDRRLNMAQEEEQQERLGHGQVLAALGPHDLARGRQDMAVQRALMFGGPGGAPQQMRGPGVGSQYQANLPNVSGAAPFFSDSAILASEEPFWNAVAGSTQGAIRPQGLAEAGFEPGAAARAQGRMTQFADDTQSAVQDRRSATRATLDHNNQMSLAALQQALDPIKKDPNKGSPWWRKALGGAAAAGLVATGWGAGFAPNAYKAIA